MAYPPVVIVDRQNNPIGLAMLKEAWERGLYYRVVGILVEDDAGRILLQQRAATMDLNPGTWDLSVAGHVDEGQTYQTAVVRELEEELGLQDVDLEDLGINFYSYINDGRKMNNFLNLFRVVVPADTKFAPEEHEVSATRWFTREDLAEAMDARPEQFSPFIKEIRSRSPELFQFRTTSLVQ